MLDRERSVGLRLSAYLASKAAVLLTLAAIQTVAMVAIVFGLRPLDEPLRRPWSWSASWCLRAGSLWEWA